MYNDYAMVFFIAEAVENVYVL